MAILRKIGFLLLLLSFLSFMACSSGAGRARFDMRAEMQRVRDSISLNRFEAAHRLIDRHLAEAKDSDTYYSWLVSKNSTWYSQMQDDSFMVTSERIRQYLLRHEHEPNDTRQWLWAEWLMARGVYYGVLRGQLDSAIVCTQEAIHRIKGMGSDWGMRIMGLTNLADYYRQGGQLDKSTEVYMQALNAADSLDATDDERIAILIGISTAYTFMNDYTSSHQWWERTAQMLPRMRQADRFIYYNNRGNDYCFQKKYDEAFKYFSKAADLVRGNPDKKWDYYTSCINLAQVYLAKGQAVAAKPYVEQADSFFHKIGYPPFIYYITTEKIELALLEGRAADALRMVEEGAHEEAVHDMKVPRLKAAERVYEETGNWQQVFQIRSQWQALSDSVQGVNTKMQLTARLMQYEHDKRLAEQQRTIERQQSTTRMAWALLVIAILAIAVLVFILLLRRRRQRIANLTMSQQIVSLRMENTRNRITPHFIFNALNHEMLQQREGRSVDFSALTTLLRRGVEQADVLQTTLGEEMAFVDYYVEIEGRQIGPDFHYIKDIAADVDIDAIRLPAMTLQIFAENAIKHGLRRQGGTLTIRITRQQQATLAEVMDDGQGLNPSYQEHTGMKVVRQTIQMLNDRQSGRPITFGLCNMEKGCRAWILLPDEFDYQVVTI